jgi:glycosyltransferase involved in cell wall biosynthesis
MARILIITPYTKWFPPKNGGNMRAFYLMRELSRSHEVHAVTLQPVAELKGKRDGFEFPATLSVYGPASRVSISSRLMSGRIASAVRARWLQRSLSRSASSVLLETFGPIRALSRQHRFDVVIFNVLDSLVTIPVVRRLIPDAVRIVNTENVDNAILANELENRAFPDGDRKRAELRARYDYTLEMETTLADTFDAFWAASEPDRASLARLNHDRLPGYVVPNGVDTIARPYDGRPSKAANKSVLFCGSLDYFPNRDGLDWFYKSIWPLVKAEEPGARLRVIGKGSTDSDFTDLRNDASVSFLGEVDDVVSHYHDTGVCVVPLRSGSGTRLKVLEAMSMGNPIVSTSMGAAGINVTDGTDIIINDSEEDISASIVSLLNDRSRFDSIRTAARKLVEAEYDWTVSGARMNASIAELMRKPAPASR